MQFILLKGHNVKRQEQMQREKLSTTFRILKVSRRTKLAECLENEN
jgi:hypothetical protein